MRTRPPPLLQSQQTDRDSHLSWHSHSRIKSVSLEHRPKAPEMDASVLDRRFCRTKGGELGK